jgi:membrane-associated phospholipid phosphatase
MQALDHRIVAWMSGLDLPLVTPVMKLASAVGTDGVVFILIAVVVAALRRRPIIIGATVAAILCSHIASTALKDAFDRRRPSMVYADVHPLVSMPHSAAMPSGHAWIAFSAATVLGAAEPALRIPLFALAGLIAISRVYLGVHYPSDVLVGAAGGALTGLAVLAVCRLVGRGVQA